MACAQDVDPAVFACTSCSLLNMDVLGLSVGRDFHDPKSLSRKAVQSHQLVLVPKGSSVSACTSCRT